MVKGSEVRRVCPALPEVLEDRFRAQAFSPQAGLPG